MPTAALRPCSRCGVAGTSRQCQVCATKTEQARGSAAARGYTHYWSATFVPGFKQQLAGLGIPPACGYSLPHGPDMRPFSQCRQEGRLNVQHLHVDHQPPLAPHERTSRHAVCDALRVGLLCRPCHSRKTLQELRGAP